MAQYRPGEGTNGQLGDGSTTTQRNTPIQVSELTLSNPSTPTTTPNPSVSAPTSTSTNTPTNTPTSVPVNTPAITPLEDDDNNGGNIWMCVLLVFVAVFIIGFAVLIILRFKNDGNL